MHHNQTIQYDFSSISYWYGTHNFWGMIIYVNFLVTGSKGPIPLGIISQTVLEALLTN